MMCYGALKSNIDQGLMCYETLKSNIDQGLPSTLVNIDFQCSITHRIARNEVI